MKQGTGNLETLRKYTRKDTQMIRWETKGDAHNTYRGLGTVAKPKGWKITKVLKNN